MVRVAEGKCHESALIDDPDERAEAPSPQSETFMIASFPCRLSYLAFPTGSALYSACASRWPSFVVETVGRTA